MTDEDDGLEKGVTELVGLDPTSVHGVRDPAHGSPFLLMKSAANAPRSVMIGGVEYVPEAVAKSDSQESDHMAEMLTGEASQTALCNAATADGSRCRRSPAAGSTRCHLHEGVALKGTSVVNVSKQLQRLGELYPELPDYSIAKGRAQALITFHRLRALHAAGGASVAKGALTFTPEHADEIVRAVKAAEEEMRKGAIQEALNGMATPEARGSIRSGRSGVSGPATGSVRAGVATQAANGLPGVVGPLQGGQSAYLVPAEAGLNGGGEIEEGASEGLAAIMAAMSGPSQELPSGPTPANYAKEIKDAHEELAKAVEAYNTAEARGDARFLGGAKEEVTLKALAYHAAVEQAVRGGR